MNNITLIGMPGAGKSFIGKQLADDLEFSFVDPDKLLEAAHAKPLHAVVESLGEAAFLQSEADLSVAALRNVSNTVLATGGSIIYSPETMKTLSKLSTIIYLKVPIDELQKRVGDAPRGIIGGADKTFAQLFHERTPLYQRWASLTVDATQTPRKVVDNIKIAIPNTTEGWTVNAY